MSGKRNMRRLTWLPWTTLLIAAIGCGGGGDKSPTGPTGPDDPGPNNPGPNNPDAMDFRLVALGRVGVPVEAEIEDCKLTRFKSGKIAIDPKSGEWQVDLQVHDDTGDWGFRDWGQSLGNGTEVLFESDYSGITYDGTVNGDGTEVTMMYDWCADGVPDVNLVFNR